MSELLECKNKKKKLHGKTKAEKTRGIAIVKKKIKYFCTMTCRNGIFFVILCRF